jgi:hypothetical protein
MRNAIGALLEVLEVHNIEGGEAFADCINDDDDDDDDDGGGGGGGGGGVDRETVLEKMARHLSNLESKARARALLEAIRKTEVAVEKKYGKAGADLSGGGGDKGGDEVDRIRGELKALRAAAVAVTELLKTLPRNMPIPETHSKMGALSERVCALASHIHPQGAEAGDDDSDDNNDNNGNNDNNNGGGDGGDRRDSGNHLRLHVPKYSKAARVQISVTPRSRRRQSLRRARLQPA